MTAGTIDLKAMFGLYFAAVNKLRLDKNKSMVSVYLL